MHMDVLLNPSWLLPIQSSTIEALEQGLKHVQC